MAEKDGKLIGFGIAAPRPQCGLSDGNRSGRLFPVMPRLLWSSRPEDPPSPDPPPRRHPRVPGQRSRCDALPLDLDPLRRARHHWGEAGWILEDNPAMNAGLEKMTFSVYKTYRLYDRRI